MASDSRQSTHTHTQHTHTQTTPLPHMLHSLHFIVLPVLVCSFVVVVVVVVVVVLLQRDLSVHHH